jgi:hypothetical protein
VLFFHSMEQKIARGLDWMSITGTVESDLGLATRSDPTLTSKGLRAHYGLLWCGDSASGSVA